MRIATLLRCNVSHVQKLLKHERTIVEEDKYLVRIRAGTGGNGLSRYNGVGGNGGSVYLLAQPGMGFVDIKKKLGGKMKIAATSGQPSQKTKLLGLSGEDKVFPVPVGIEAVDEEQNLLIARCTRPFHKYLIAKGGSGGSRENGYIGEKGEELDVAFHLKLRPNVGLVGFPNAGKSTFLKAIVPKKSVKIAPYPFTTVKPQVAFYKTENTITEEQFTLSIADLPGLIEGASQNRGKGYKFLKHLEYCEILCFVVDVTGFMLSSDMKDEFRTPLESVALLCRELEAYDYHLVTKPSILILNKVDLVENLQEATELAKKLKKPGWHTELPLEMHPNSPIRFDFVVLTSLKSGDIADVKTTIVRLHKELNQPQVLPESHDEGKRFL